MDWLSDSSPLIIGHRGASAGMPENTLAAFQKAADDGADGIELDVQLSADGELVIIHDNDVSRTTNGTGSVTKMSLAALKALDAGQGQLIPTLDELFEMLGPRLLYNIEIKNFDWRDRGIETAVADRVSSFHLENKVLISSFNPFAVRRARRAFSKVTPVAMIRAPGILKYSYWLAEGEADHPHFSMVDDRYMTWMKTRGYKQVNVWTVDDPAEVLRLARLGVNALITNDPAAVRKVLTG